MGVLSVKISEVERIVGLSKKAIRLYESRGLLTVERVPNGYREYSDEDVEKLKQIKLLRLAGISVSDIKLLLHGVLPMEELLDKRKKELDREYGEHSAQYAFYKALLDRTDGTNAACAYALEETEEVREPCGAVSVGLDIGTTTISATVIDHASKRQAESYTLPNIFTLPSDPDFCEQDADGILERTKNLLDHILASYKSVRSIGITGQMHGIVYVDSLGTAVSPLFTWEDKRGDRKTERGETYCEEILRRTGERISTGYGFATHYYNARNGLVPEKAVAFCSIMDYCTMRLTDTATPLVHATNAASFGFYDVQAARFKNELLEKIFSDAVQAPRVTDAFTVAGHYRGIPVSVAIGDNQADFLGSVRDLQGEALVNIGTGSQISMLQDTPRAENGLELRPFFAGKYLLCGAALCGGSAYAMLERFFRGYEVACGRNSGAQYETMNRLASEAYAKGEHPLSVDTTFLGTRRDPMRRGSISEIGVDAFTPSRLILGVLFGMCRELYMLYRTAGCEKKRIVASGGAVQKNAVLQSIIAETFGAKTVLGAQTEEASIGAALFSAVACGVLSDIEEISAYIFYKDGEETR